MQNLLQPTGRIEEEEYQDDDVERVKCTEFVPLQKKCPKVISTIKFHDYSPLNWQHCFDKLIYFKDIPIYIAGNTGPIFLCLHGTGLSALSFGLLAKEIKKFGICVAFDFRGHGSSKQQVEDGYIDLSSELLIEETHNVIDHLKETYQNSIILVGHSMGGAIAARCRRNVQGIFLIETSETSIIQSSHSMELLLKCRPREFKNYEAAIKYMQASYIQNYLSSYEAARISIPHQLNEHFDEAGGLQKLSWKINLLKTKKHWFEWFQGISKLLNESKIPVMAFVSDFDSGDPLFDQIKTIVVPSSGHCLQEDMPKELAHMFNYQVRMNKLVKEEIQAYKFEVDKN